MKLFAPEYYKEFACIADACRHSCCIGWEIDIDEETQKKYGIMTHDYGKMIRNSMEGGWAPHFTLDKDARCPHLDEKGLCRIITNLGEGYLCEICREHPRFYHRTAKGLEVGIGMSCEEACRLILSSDAYARFEEIGVRENELLPDFDALLLRDEAYEILAESLPLEERMQRIASRFDVPAAILTDGEWRELLSALEYLRKESRTRFACYTGAPISRDERTEAMLTRALANFIFRHASMATSEYDFRAAVGFSLFCTRLLSSLAAEGGDLHENARLLSEELEYSEENTETVMQEFFFAL